MIKTLYYYAITKFSLIFFSLYTISILTNNLSLVEYGELDLLIVTITLLGVILNLGISSAINRELNLFNRKIGDVFTNSLLFFFKSLLISIFIYTLNTMFNILNQNYLFLILMITNINILNGYLIGIVRATNKSKLFFIVNLIQQVLYLSYLLYYQNNLTVEKVLYIIFFYSFISLSIYLYYFKNSLGGKYDKSIYLSLSKYGLPLVLGGVAEFIFNSSDKYMINYFLGKESVALYSVNYKIAAMLLIVAGVFQMLWPRYMYRIYNKYKDYSNLYRAVLNFYSFVIINIALCIITWREKLILLITNENYLIADGIVVIVISGIILYSLHYILNAGIHISGKSYIMTNITIIAGVLNILLNYFFIPLYGYTAAAFTTVIAMILILFATYYFSNKLIVINYDLMKIFYIYTLFVFFAFILYFFHFSFFESILLNIGFLFISAFLLLSFKDFKALKVLVDE